jgi:hypothetical protein
MPPQAYALVDTFAVLSLVVGSGAAWIVGPRRVVAVVLPSLAAFGALYLVGHRLGWAFGPEVVLYGFSVALVSDLAFAIAASGATAVAQRAMLGVVARSQAG